MKLQWQVISHTQARMFGDACIRLATHYGGPVQSKLVAALRSPCPEKRAVAG
jgi:hypothetical protein